MSGIFVTAFTHRLIIIENPAKESELRQAVAASTSQLEATQLSLAEYKHRALTAEESLQNASTSSSTVSSLEVTLKEKTALIGKLRHQAVILNEHLTEALRRMAKNEGEGKVDRSVFFPLPPVLVCYLLFY